MSILYYDVGVVMYCDWYDIRIEPRVETMLDVYFMMEHVLRPWDVVIWAGRVPD
jgi:hypothetical protein